MSANHARAQQMVSSMERLRRAAGRIWETLEEELELSPVQAHVLEAIGRGARQVSSVADRCGRHVSSASRLVDGLVGRGLVSRVEDPDDRRAVVLELTPAGERALAAIEQAHARQIARILEHLEPDEADAVVAAMDRLADAAEQADASP